LRKYITPINGISALTKLFSAALFCTSLRGRNTQKIISNLLIIISALFLFSVIAYAQDTEIKEGTQKNDAAVSASNDTYAPMVQNPDIPESEKSPLIQQQIEDQGKPFKPIDEQSKDKVADQQKSISEIKQNQTEAQPDKAKQVQTLKPAVPTTIQTTVPQISEIKSLSANVSSNNTLKPAENKSSLNTYPTASVKNTAPEIPPMPAPVTNRTSVSNGHISLNFDDTDIYSIIQTVFSEILKVNYIIDPKVKGRITFKSVAPVPKENVLPLMEVILRLNGVAIVEENSLYRIIPIGDLAREPSAINVGRSAEKVEVKGKALLQVVPINYLQSSEIIKLITPFTSVNAVIVDVPKTNHIIIVDTDANVKRLLQLIDIFDSEQQKNKGPQVFVHHIQNGKAKDISALLQQIFLGSRPPAQTNAGNVSTSASSSSATPKPSSAPAARPYVQATSGQGGSESLVSDSVKIYSDDILNAIIILGTSDDYEVIKETIAKLDIVPRQVLIEGEIASIQLTDKMSLGLAWSLQTNGLNMNPVTISLNPSSLSSDTTKTSGLSLIGIDSGGSVRAVINALASKSKAKLLASPHIMVSDNHEARIQVGQQVPIPTSEIYSTSGVASTQTTIQYKDIGIILKVKPQINDSGLVALEISQEVSTYSTEKLSGQDEIILNKTEASTNLVVQDGQTIVIGGLIREDDSKSRQGIPFLYKIPLLGYLFGDTSNDVSRSELVIMLTPHVIKNQQDAKSITNNFTDKMTDEEMNKEIKKGIQVKTEEQKKEVLK
jgi:type II secretory pathway component GspD/PulD (secretin)